MRWLASVLVLANLGLFIWGWSQDAPINAPLPPMPAAPGVIHLLAELPTSVATPLGSAAEDK